MPSDVVWSASDGAKYAGLDIQDQWQPIGKGLPNSCVKSATVADGVVDLSTGEDDGFGHEIGAFSGCVKLETVMLPESLKKIGVSAFASCVALVHVDIPSGVNEIRARAFHKCSCLKNVTIPEGILHLPDFIFNQCMSLKSVKLPSSLKTIGEAAMRNCMQLSSINWDAIHGVTKIGKEAFFNCVNIKVVKVPPLVKVIEEKTFVGCSFISSIELPPSLEEIKKIAFGSLIDADLCITVPETVKCIECYREYDRIIGVVGINTMAHRIQLPTSLQFLHNGWDLEGLLHHVREVVISCKVDVQLLVNFVDLFEDKDINGLPFLNPVLKFRVLHYCGSSGDGELPPIESHVPFFTFSYDMSVQELKRFAKEGKNLPAVVEKAYDKRRKAVLNKLNNKGSKGKGKKKRK